MHVIFLIGNGFDINLGLKTRYESFYPYFVEKASKENMIRNWINGNEKLWSDLEEKLGQALINVPKEKQMQFYADKEELDRLLIEYLEKEQEKYSYENAGDIKREFTRSMRNFSLGMSENDIDSINNTLGKYAGEEHTYSYIVFNYTNILDNILELYNEKVIGTHRAGSITYSDRLGKIIHIHGTTDEEMILGVNDEEQIENDWMKKDDIFLDTFIKKRMNNSIGQRKTENALKIISQSHIICIFGMSIGNTDKMWWQELIKWLGANENNKLIIFWKGYEDALKKKLPSTVIRLNDQIRRNVFNKGKDKYDESYYLKIKDRILISYNANIFSLPKVQDEKQLDKGNVE